MLLNRIIPVLLLSGKGLVKTKKFKSPTYIGDPINAIKIFNQKMVDELIFLDINASREKRGPNYEVLRNIASECFMPLGYGGGIQNVGEVIRILNMGFEKVIINNHNLRSLDLIHKSSDLTGAQSIVGAIDIKKNVFGKYRIYDHVSKKCTRIDVFHHVHELVEAGAGEIFVNDVDRDGMMMGYNIEIIRDISKAIEVPLVSCGGAGKLMDFRNVVYNGGASAVGAGSFFVFHGPNKGVLINYPDYKTLEGLFK